MKSSRAAGTNGKSCGSAKECLKFEERPSTPPDIAKYRKSNALAPGVRFQHHGTAADYAAKNLQDLTFGECTVRGNNTAASLISRAKITELESMNLRKSEKVYKSQAREPLGRTIDRGIVLPSKFSKDDQAFGVASNSAHPAKEIIFPVLEEQPDGIEDVYKRSHGAIGPGEQISRGYDWHGADMSSHIFGLKGNSVAYNGISSSVAEALKGDSYGAQSSSIARKMVEDHRSTGDYLGQVRKLGQQVPNRDENLAFGIPSGIVRSGGRPRLTAQEVIRGTYTGENNRPDKDLGRSLTPGFRNTSAEAGRTFGCPSIRHDLTAQPLNRRSIADSQNYGDDIAAQQLISPTLLSSLNISPSALEEPKSRNQISSLFSKIGYDLEPYLFDIIFSEAARGHLECSVTDFRNVLNDFLNAEDMNKENEWLRSHGG